jgi:hypothetical protein
VSTIGGPAMRTPKTLKLENNQRTSLKLYGGKDKYYAL